MRDFGEIVRRHLGPLPLEPARAREITAELAHQLEDKFQEGVERGLPEARALADALGQFGDWREVRRAIFCAESGENTVWPQRSAISRRVSWAALAVMAMLCLAPSFRQALRSAPSAWSQSPPGFSEGALRGMAERGLKEHDAPLVAFASLHLMDMPAASRYAEQAIAMDPRLTWIGARFVYPIDPRVYNKQWAERLVAWDPDNAVPRLFVADQIYRTAMPVIAGSLYDAPVARLAETTAWGEKMRAAIAAPRYDNYMQRRFELDRGMVGRLQGGRADALVLYSTQLQGIPDPWDVQAYAGLLTRKLGPEAEHAGNSAEARSLYWDLANFGERLEKGAEWEGDQEGAWRMEAAAFKSLVSLAERAGNKEEAAAYDLLRQRAESSDAEARRRWESSFRSQWTGAKRPAQLAWPAAGLVLLAGIACVAWVALLGFRSESRVLSGWRGTVALGLSYSPVVLLAASATMYAAMSPYLRTSEEFATRREVFNALVPFWFGFWEGWDVFGWGPRFYIRQMMVPVLLSVAVLITGIAVLRWVARSRAGHTSQAG